MVPNFRLVMLHEHEYPKKRKNDPLSLTFHNGYDANR